jgi:hypothetical protein
MFESVFSGGVGIELTLGSGLLALAVSIIMGIMLSATYTLMNRRKIGVATFGVTLVILPAIVTLIIALVGNNVARAFSLAGAFAIIRFRSEQREAKEIAFVLLAMAIGLGCGTGYVLYAVIFGLILGAVAVGAELVFKNTDNRKILKVYMPENLDYSHIMDKVLAKHTKSNDLIKVKTVDLGSLYQLTYKVTLLPETNERKMIDEIRTKNGNLTVSLMDFYDVEKF